MANPYISTNMTAAMRNRRFEFESASRGLAAFRDRTLPPLLRRSVRVGDRRRYWCTGPRYGAPLCPGSHPSEGFRGGFPDHRRCNDHENDNEHRLEGLDRLGA